MVMVAQKDLHLDLKIQQMLHILSYGGYEDYPRTILGVSKAFSLDQVASARLPYWPSVP
jgi:hypothetical protein